MAHNREEFAEITNVSRETLDDYVRWQQLLQRWNAKINLVAKGEVGQFWGRHALDSWQICPLLPENTVKILDLGSGAGFPGIAAAIHCKHLGAGQVVLTESAGKKASFLKTVIRELDLPASITAERIENLPAQNSNIITARAFAPLDRLFSLAEPHMAKDAQLILLKGESVDDEIKKAEATWTFTASKAKSHSDARGVILTITGLSRKAEL